MPKTRHTLRPSAGQRLLVLRQTLKRLVRDDFQDMEQVNVVFQKIEKTRTNVRMLQESRIGKLMRKIATLEIEPDPYMIKSRCFALMQRYQRTLVNYKQRHVAEFFENYKCNHITDFYDNADTPADVPDYEPEESDPFAILRNDIETDSDCGEEDVGGGGRTYFIVYDPSACEGNVNEDNDHYNNVKDESSDEVPREEAVVVKQESESAGYYKRVDDAVGIESNGLIFDEDKIKIKKEDTLLKQEEISKETVTVKRKRNKRQGN